MGDNYSHYLISYNITNLSWVSYVTPAPFSEIRVTINFSTKFHHKNFIPRSDRDQDHSLLLISADDPIRSTVSVYSSTTVAETTNMEEMIRKSIDQALQNVGNKPLSAGARYCTRELLTEIVFALLEKKETILGVHLIEMDMQVVFKHCFVIGGCDGPRQSSCCICLEDFIPPSSSSDQALEVLPCWHVFHYDCLRSWRRTHTRPHCPLCRKIRGRDFIISL